MSSRAKRLVATLAGALATMAAVVLPASPAPGAATASAAASTAAGGTAAGRTAAPDWVISMPLAQKQADVQKVIDYWKPERLKKANSYAPAQKAQASPSATTAAAVNVTNATSAGQTASIHPTSGRATAKGGSPATVGKVFFRIGTKEYWCSATAVHSANKNLVATAGHCAYDVRQAKAVEDWIFIPGYTPGGGTDWGIYVGHTLNLHDHFAGLADFDYDYAFVTVHRGFTWQPEKDAKGQAKKDPKGNVLYKAVDAGRLEDNVGGQGFLWNQKLKVLTYAFGYPAGEQPDGSRPYDGSALKRCVTKSRTKVTARPWLLNKGLSFQCMFTSGASGGPWLIRYNVGTGNGYLNGINSLTWDRNADRRYDHISSPYFNTATYVIYKHATGQSTG